MGTDQGRAEWARFVDRHGGRRAAWLIKTFGPPSDGSAWVPPTDVRSDPLVSSIAGFPPTIEIWMARGGAALGRVATLTVDRTGLAFDIPDPTDPDPRRWWNSFELATAVGLGTTIDLGPTTPDDIDVLYAVGRGGPHPSTLFGAHKEAGALSILPPGTPTKHLRSAADRRTARRSRLLAGTGHGSTGWLGAGA